MQNKTEAVRTKLPTDRRHYQRLAKKTEISTGRVTYPLDEENFASGVSENISLGGILMQVPEPFEEGTLIQLKITLPGWQKYHPGFIKVMENSIGSPMTAICEVMRCRQLDGQYTTAARFVNIDPDDFVAFQRYLEKENKGN